MRPNSSEYESTRNEEPFPASVSDIYPSRGALTTAHEGTNRDWSVEQALDIAHLFIASEEVDLQQVLRLFKEAIGAEHVSLFIVPEKKAGSGEQTQRQLSLFEAPHASSEGSDSSEGGGVRGNGISVERAREEGAEEEDLLQDILARPSASGPVLPIMSPPHRLHGYLEVTYPLGRGAPQESDSRTLHFLSNLLASYLDRRSSRRSATHEQKLQAQRELADARPEPVLIRNKTHVLHANAAAMELLAAQTPDDVIGRRIHDFVSADQYALLDVQWERLYPGNRPADQFEHSVIGLNGEERVVQSFCIPFTLDDTQAAQVILRDITEQRRSQERYRRFIETIDEAIWCVEITPSFSVEEEAPAAQTQQVWERARFVECNDVMAQLLGCSNPEDVLGNLVKEHFQFAADAIRDVIEDFVQAGYRLRNHDYVTGQKSGARHFVLNAVSTERRGQLTRVWGSCVEVTDRVQLEQRMVEALEKQQNEIGRELHDSVGQLLTGIRMLSENLASRMADENDNAADRLDKIVRLSSEASEQISGIYHGLSPTPLQGTPLATALEDLAATTNGLQGLSCHFVAEDVTGDVEEECKLQLYRIAQEAVNNAVRHGAPTRIQITLRGKANGLQLRVEDDGAGFLQDEAPKSDSLGLHNMRYRARSIQGTLTVDSAPGKGTAIICEAPACLT